MNKILDFLNRWSAHALFIAAFILAVMIGMIDYLTGFEVSFAFFYLLPVSLAAWGAGRRAGVVLSLASATIWLLANQLAGEKFTNPVTPYWNASTRLGFFLVVTVLLSTMRHLYEHERLLAHTDALTSALNRRAFYDLVESELTRMRRYQKPFTVVYIDLDGFKVINDRDGHKVGDLVLKEVVYTLIHNTRETDFVCRMGGDEFALLLPETDSQSAQLILPRLRHMLLENMRKHQWMVTFSMGVLTCLAPSSTAPELLALADQEMYKVKSSSKDGIRYRVYAG